MKSRIWQLAQLALMWTVLVVAITHIDEAADYIAQFLIDHGSREWAKSVADVAFLVGYAIIVVMAFCWEPMLSAAGSQFRREKRAADKVAIVFLAAVFTIGTLSIAALSLIGANAFSVDKPFVGSARAGVILGVVCSVAIRLWFTFNDRQQ